MSRRDRMEQGLRRILWALRPYLHDIVIIGGWVPHLYRRYGGFTKWRSAISFTQEVDILLERDVPVRAGAPLAAGDEVVGRIEVDLRAIAKASKVDRDEVRSAANQLDVALRPSPKAIVRDAAAMLAERDSLAQSAAEIDTAGHLTDFLDVLRSLQ